MRQNLAGVLFVIFLAACGGGGSGGSSSTSTPTNTGGGNTTPPNNPGGGGSGGGGSNNPPASFGHPSDSQIRPGVIVQAAGSQCTSNFIYTDGSGNYYIGAAAHCFSPDSNSGIDPCDARSEALGIDVEIQNASFMGSLAYTSWQTMQDNGETPGSGICTGNDFALIKIDSRDVSNVHPAARSFGGPTALFTGDANAGDGVLTYGQSPFNFGLSSQQSKEGRINSLSPDGWIYSVSLDSPGVPGDSGSAVLHETGRAIGVLSTLNTCIGLCPTTSNGVVNLEMALAYANATVFGNQLTLVTWSSFTP